MKVLVVTTDTQGQRPNDFCWATPGELAQLGFICGRDRDPDTDEVDMDGGCGCGRAFHGVISRKGTTTAKVIDHPAMTPDMLMRIFGEHDGGFGWDEDDLREMVEELEEVLMAFAADTIVERRGDIICAR